MDVHPLSGEDEEEQTIQVMLDILLSIFNIGWHFLQSRARQKCIRKKIGI